MAKNEAVMLENLLHAMEIIAAHEIDKNGVDKTVSGIVTEVLGFDRYKVLLQGAEYNIPCAIQMSFAVRDKVWVTIPQGNFQNKFICGKAT